MNALDRTCRALLLRQLQHMRSGSLCIRDELTDGLLCGDPAAPVAAVTVHNPRFFRAVVLGGHIGAVESYAEGFWDTDDLVAVVRLLVRERDVLDGLERGAARLVQPVRALGHWLDRNTKGGSARNIKAHYDLGNDFFATFLDDTWTYSCGYFATEDTSLRQASIAKYDRLCRKIGLQPHHRVVEIGTGWGGFAIHAASHYGCHITTTTISEQQFTLARERVRAFGLEDRITILKQDYRDLTGTFDRLVSIEMIEAVGHQFFDTYFAKCAALLEPDGIAAIQAITIQEQYYEAARREVDFIKKYIFPGSCIPSVGVLNASAARARLRLLHLEDIGPHYATTLAAWRERFQANAHAIDAQGFDLTFRRLWDFYFAYCEGGFREGAIGDAQLVFGGPKAFLPPQYDEVLETSRDPEQATR